MILSLELLLLVIMTAQVSLISGQQGIYALALACNFVEP
jgi:hypothetical protein